MKIQQMQMAKQPFIGLFKADTLTWSSCCLKQRANMDIPYARSWASKVLAEKAGEGIRMNCY